MMSEEEDITKLAELVEDDSLVNLNKLLSSPKKKRKKRIISVKRDKFGNRIYPYKGKKKSVKTPKAKGGSSTILHCSDNGTDISYEMDIDAETIQVEITDDGCSKKKKKQSWKDRMMKLETAWASERQSFLECVKGSYKLGETCMLCKLSKAVIRCIDCMAFELCEGCDKSCHEENPLHNRVSFANGFFQPLAPTEVLDENYKITNAIRFVPLLTNAEEQCECGSTKFTKINSCTTTVFVTMAGKYKLAQFHLRCCHCHQVKNPFTMKNIVISGFWPSSPVNFNYLFQVDVLRTWDQFRKQMPGSSESSFLESLNALTLSFGRKGKIMHSSFSQAFKNWNFVGFEIDQLQEKKWMKCPCCTIKQHSCHVDGNCKLYRYKTSGSRRRTAYYNDVFVVDDKKVDDFISTLKTACKGKSKQGTADVTCGGEWSAARNVERKKKSVDYTGLEVASCRHQFGQKAINMKRGEVYAYPMYLLKSFILPSNVTFIFADIICKHWPYFCKFDKALPSKIKGALSVMHAKGHSLACQVKWDGEWLKGTGRSTGEECEQVFSFLSRCANTTKYQLPENREETLTEMIMFWNRRKTMKLAETLVKKLNKIKKEEADYLSKLKQKCRDMRVSLEYVDFNVLFNEFKNSSCGDILPECEPSDCQKIILLAHDLGYIPTSVSQAITDAIFKIKLPDLDYVKVDILKKNKPEKELLISKLWNPSIKVDYIKTAADSLNRDVLIPAFQNAIQSSRFEIVHWTTKIRKYADTSKLRLACRQKLSEVNKRLKSLLSEYSNFKVADSMEFNIMTESDNRLLLELNSKRERSLEEIELLKIDMESYLVYYSSIVSKLNAELINREVFPEGHESFGSECNVVIIRTGAKFAECQLRKGLQLFKKILPEDTLNQYSVVDVNDCEGNLPDESDKDESDEEDDNDEEIRDEYVNDIVYSNEVEIETTLLDVETLRSIGVDLTGTIDLELCECGDNYVILPGELCQSRLKSRNGSNACTVISLIAGCFMSQLDRINLDCIPVYVGCMEAGNLYHDGPEFLLPQEAIDLIPFRGIEIKDERNCFLSTLKDELALLSQEANIIIITAERESTCLLCKPTSTFFFDSHMHGEMGALIAWFDDGFNDIVKYLPNISPESLIYLCSVIINNDE